MVSQFCSCLRTSKKKKEYIYRTKHWGSKMKLLSFSPSQMLSRLVIWYAFGIGFHRYLPTSGNWVVKLKFSVIKIESLEIPFCWWSRYSIGIWNCVHRSVRFPMLESQDWHSHLHIQVECLMYIRFKSHTPRHHEEEVK